MRLGFPREQLNSNAIKIPPALTVVRAFSIQDINPHAFGRYCIRNISNNKNCGGMSIVYVADVRIVVFDSASGLLVFLLHIIFPS
jgi:hypothetical protein